MKRKWYDVSQSHFRKLLLKSNKLQNQMAIALVVLRLPTVEFLTNFNCFLVLTFELKIVIGFAKSILESSYKDLKTCNNYLTFNMLFKHNSKSVQIFKDHSNFNSEIVKENWNIYIFWGIFKKFQMFICFGLCNMRETVFLKCNLQLHKQLIYVRQAVRKSRR